MNQKNHTGSLLHKGWLTIMLLALLSVMAGCGGGGNNAPPPVVNLDPTGYYSNTGTLPALGVTDMQAMIYNNRFIMVSKAQGYYYDGPITVSGNTITGNLVQAIAPGLDSDTATLSATINPDQSITGTVTHSSNNVSSNFTLNYATGRTNSTVAAIANPNWAGTLYNLATDTLTFSLADNAAGAAAMTTITPLATTNTGFRNCMFTGTLTPINGTSLYAVSFTATGQQCFASGPYTGLAALRTQTNLNDTVVIAAYEFDGLDYLAVFGEFQ